MYYEYTPEQKAKAIFLEINNDSMAPQVITGAKIVGLPVERENLQTGDVIAVEVGNDGFLVGRYQQGNDRLRIAFDNPEFAPLSIDWNGIGRMYGQLCITNMDVV